MKESQKLLHGISEEEWKGIVAKTYTCQTFTIIFLFKPCNNPVPFPFYSSANSGPEGEMTCPCRNTDRDRILKRLEVELIPERSHHPTNPILSP